eukprot:Skav200443  [mRNA]  locus=scaffold1922:23594:33712:- [translate_table: standard]
MSFHDPHDIPGAQVGSLKKGIEGSRRRVNPLNPKYPMLDGNARPQPVPTFEAQRHPMLRNPSSTSSMPNLHSSRSLRPAGRRTFSELSHSQSAVSLQRDALAAAAQPGQSQRLSDAGSQRRIVGKWPTLQLCKRLLDDVKGRLVDS